jgi:hypothetical protein
MRLGPFMIRFSENDQRPAFADELVPRRRKLTAEGQLTRRLLRLQSIQSLLKPISMGSFSFRQGFKPLG